MLPRPVRGSLAPDSPGTSLATTYSHHLIFLILGKRRRTPGLAVPKFGQYGKGSKSRLRKYAGRQTYGVFKNFSHISAGWPTALRSKNYGIWRRRCVRRKRHLLSYWRVRNSKIKRKFFRPYLSKFNYQTIKKLMVANHISKLINIFGNYKNLKNF